jgi:hypothetical protein
MPDLERILELATYVGATRAHWRAIEISADELLDDELSLRIDAARLAMLDVADRLDELVTNPLPEEDPV